MNRLHQICIVTVFRSARNRNAALEFVVCIRDTLILSQWCRMFSLWRQHFLLTYDSSVGIIYLTNWALAGDYMPRT